MHEKLEITKASEEETTGVVLRIERGSVYDGDGFRTVVFLKGCPLRCLWCSTPESQSHGIEYVKGTTYGQVMSVEDVMKEVRKDSCCYFHSGGGLTLSGGEILAQPIFTRSLLKAAWEECVNTAIETTFFAPWKVVSSILPYVDTAFVDIKMFNNQLHKKYVGSNNKRILENLLKTNELEENFRLIVRVPVIPGINDAQEELEGIGEFCAKLTHLEHVQLLPYHRLGTETYKKLDREYQLADILPPSSEHMSQCRKIVRKHVEKVI
ncbi:glycyl-radical enzyme activating protein [Niallia alba]|uniref:glycyl-radical enzyme activating protein n=1 Tax=Niallia alba TaxID=2729105 RepID=UPI00399F1A77